MCLMVSQRQLVDAFYAFNCAAQDLSPICIQFLERLSDAVIPNPPRTREMIAQGLGHRYSGKIIFMNEIAKGDDADISEDFFVYWKNRLHRPETFAGDYCHGPKRPAILGFGGEWRSEKDDPDDVLASRIRGRRCSIHSWPEYQPGEGNQGARDSESQGCTRGWANFG